MLPNLIVIIGGIVVLAFIAALWLRQNLIHDLNVLSQNENLLRKDLEKRRDFVPFLLEGAREGSELKDEWQALARKRTSFMQVSTLAQELEFEKSLQIYLDSNNIKTVVYLEAKKDIQEMSKLIEEQKEKIRNLSQNFNAKRKEFPYSLVSGIFAIREVNSL